MEYEVLINLYVRYRKSNLNLSVRLHLYAVLSNVNIIDIYVSLFIILLVGNYRKDFFSILGFCFDFVTYQRGAYLESATVNNQAVVILQCGYRFIKAACKKKCRNGN